MRTSALRETAKWIAAAFTGSGAILFSGLSFTNTSKVAIGDGWLKPILLAALPLVAAAWAIGCATRVVSARDVAIGRLLPLFAKARLGVDATPAGPDEIGDIERMLPGVTTRYGGIARLDQRLVDEYGNLQEAERRAHAQDNAQRATELADATSRFEAVQAGVPELLQAAEFRTVKRRFGIALVQFGLAALVAIVGVAASGVSAATADRPAKGSEPPTAAIVDPTPVVVILSDGAATRDVEHCTVRAGSTAVAIGGTFTRPVLVMNPPQTALATSSPSSPTTAGPGRCAGSWTWTTEAGQVTAVPIA
nr:hypothetical protein [uncultured Actinoplanes sp.]